MTVTRLLTQLCDVQQYTLLVILLRALSRCLIYRANGFRRYEPAPMDANKNLY